LSAEGYTLANRYYDQRQRRSPKYVQSALKRKAYALRLNEAINAGVMAKYHCGGCKFEQVIDLYALRDRLQAPAIKLSAALSNRPWCRRCGIRMDYLLDERVDANQLVPDFAIKMPLLKEPKSTGSFAKEPEDDIGDTIPVELFADGRECA
jgi:hypothetical protein